MHALTRRARYPCLGGRLLFSLQPRHPVPSSASARMLSQFRVVEHEIRGQHTREYPAATANGDSDTVHLAVKQYIPLETPEANQRGVTILAAQANGFPKEMYEPIWDEINKICVQHDFRIRSIWIADMWNQGQSGIINEDILGRDPGWFDHSRDLLALINQQQDAMPHPIVGIGHSVGGAQLAHLSLMHPRLLKMLVLMDPVIQLPNGGISAAVNSTGRRDIWESREAARQSFMRNKFYQSWDPRVLDLWLKYGLRSAPTALFPTPPGQPERTTDPRVTLATSKHQEITLYVRPTFRPEAPEAALRDDEAPADLDPSAPKDVEYPFYRPEPVQIYQKLPEIRPSVLYVYGEASDFCTSERRDQHRDRTGTGVGGSGGTAAGEVEQVVVPKHGHLVPFEEVNKCAESITEFIGRRLSIWHKHETEFQEQWLRKSKKERATVDQRWLDNIKPRTDVKKGLDRTKL